MKWNILSIYNHSRSVRVAERLALPTSDHGVTGSNPAGGEILPEPKRRFIAQSLSCSPFHRLEMTEILSKGRKTLTHPSIQSQSMCFTNEPAHEFIVLFVLRKLILQTFMRSHPMGLDVWLLFGSFDYFHILCVRTAKADVDTYVVTYADLNYRGRVSIFSND